MGIKSLGTLVVDSWVSGGELVGVMPGTLGDLDINFEMGGWVVKTPGLVAGVH